MCPYALLTNLLVILFGSYLLFHSLYAVMFGKVYDTKRLKFIYKDVNPVQFWIYVISMFILSLIVFDVGYNIGLIKFIVSTYQSCQALTGIQ